MPDFRFNHKYYKTWSIYSGVKAKIVATRKPHWVAPWRDHIYLELYFCSDYVKHIIAQYIPINCHIFLLNQSMIK